VLQEVLFPLKKRGKKINPRVLLREIAWYN